MENQKIFISYSRKDLEFAKKLATDLRKAGADVWLDKLDIRLAEKWDVEIEKALESCKSLFFIVSKASIASDNVLNEVYFAMEEGKKVYPIIKEEVKLPFRLSRLQYVDLSSDYDDGLKQLLSALDLPGSSLRESRDLREDSVTFQSSPGNIGAVSNEKEESYHGKPFPDKQLAQHTVKPSQGFQPAENAAVHNPAPSNSKQKKRLIGGGILALLVIIFVWSSRSSDKNNTEEETTGNIEAVDSTPDSAVIAAMYDSAAFYTNEKDGESAFNWYMKIAEAGDAHGMWNVAFCYENGDGVEQNFDSAFEWYSKAADNGDADGMAAVAECYKKGQGVSQDPAKADEWQKKADEALKAETAQ
ncbi:MAG: hypothetical protein JWQ40_2687 [Segetibacter sp.]|nr:hypothetical protein [Segetibacter sp.]